MVLEDPVSGAYYTAVKDHPAYDIFRVTRPIVLQPYVQHRVVVIKNSQRLLTTEPRVMPISRHSTMAARGVMDVSPIQPFYILLGNFSDRQGCLPKGMMLPLIVRR